MELRPLFFTTDQRFDESRLSHVLPDGLPENIFRSKGLVAIENSDAALLWNQAGKYLTFQQIGRFQDPVNTRSEIIIGQDLEKSKITGILKSALSSLSLEKAT